MRNCNQIIKIFFLLYLGFSGEIYAQTVNQFKNEGVKYPTRNLYFKGIPVERYYKISFLDEKNPNTYLMYNYNYTNLNEYIAQIPGHGEISNTPNPSAVKMKSNVIDRAVLNNQNAIKLSQSGFTVSFWTKWPYDVNQLTSQFATIVNEGGEILWEAGIAHDRRVYVKRQVHRNRSTDTSPLWNLKFWNPEYGDIDKAVTESTNGLEWFFVMVVQEKEQLRLHIGMPNGTFDCMYINYGLNDQINYNQAQSRNMEFFGNNTEVYWQDLSVWNLPLCREEAFEYYKDCSGISAASFRLDESDQKKSVVDDDNVRMIRDAGRIGGCMNTAGNPVRLQEFKYENEVNSINNNPETAGQLVVFSNPTGSVLYIKLPFEHPKDSPISAILTDLHGITVQKLTMNNTTISNVLSYSFSQSKNIPSGIYIVKIVSGSKIYSTKLAINCGCR